MPTYSYKCNKCNENLEAVQRITDQSLTDCKKCKSKNSLEKILKSSNFTLNGKGWFKDGY